MGPNGSGKSTLANVLAGREDYEVTGGDVRYAGAGPAGAVARGARPRRSVPRLPVPGRDPRGGQLVLPAHRAERRAQAPRRRAARRHGLPLPAQGEDEVRRHGPQVHEPLGQRGLLGRREEAQRDPADGDPRAEAGHPRRDRFRARHRRPAHRRRGCQRAAQRPTTRSSSSPTTSACSTTWCPTSSTSWSTDASSRSGDKSLALELEDKGYAEFDAAATA